jgi:formamidopyrimidine-DNA glycosylase
MPEVIEVRKTRDFLLKIMKNKYIEEINILKGRYKTHKPFELYSKIKKMLPLKVLDIKTKGKFMYFVLEDDFYIYSTLGLTGGWIYKKDSDNDIDNDNDNDNEINSKNIKKSIKKYKFPKLIDYISENDILKYHKVSINNLNVEFKLKDCDKIVYFYDSLSFGTLKVVDNVLELEKKLNEIGPDIMDEKTIFDIFLERVTKKNNLEKCIGNVLVNQRIISGIGNYLRSDILWLSKISPFRKVKDLNNNELKIIYESCKKLTWGSYNLKMAIKKNIVNSSDKLPEHYHRNFFAYMCKTDIYDHNIKTEKLYEGSVPRIIYWVPEYQI